MRHYKKGRKLGTDASHTKAMKRSLVTALFLNDRIKTVEARAKEIRGDSRLLTTERIAVSAALQIAFDSLRGNIGNIPADPATLTRVATLRMKIDEALDPALGD